MTDHQGLAAPTLPTRDTSLPPPAATTPFAPPTEGPADPTLSPPPPPDLSDPNLTDHVVGQPVLPGAGPALPAPATLAPPSVGVPEPIVETGTPAPKYPKRKKSFARRVLTLLLVLAVLAGIGVGAYLAYQQLAPASDDPPAELPLDDPDTLIGRSNELVTDINDNSEELEALDQLGLDEFGLEQPPAVEVPEPDVPVAVPAPGVPAVASFTYHYVDIPNLDATISVDIASGDFEFVSADSSFRRVGDVLYVQDPDGKWTMIEGIDFAAVGITGPISVADVVPAAVEWYATSSTVTDDGTADYVIDSAQLAADSRDVLTAWLEPWGLSDTSGEVRVTMRADESGQVSSATISTSSPERTISYELIATAATALDIVAPEL